MAVQKHNPNKLNFNKTNPMKTNNTIQTAITTFFTFLFLFPSMLLGEVNMPTIDLTGEWSGMNEELSYMNLNHKDGKITGQICEMKGHDCMDIKDAKLKGNTLTFHYVFEKKKKQIQVAVQLEISDDRKTLTGKATIEEAGVHVNLKFDRESELRVEPEKENVVSSRLEGRWQINEAISNRLSTKLTDRYQDNTMEFHVDEKIVSKIPENFSKFMADKTIYTAGMAKWGEKEYPFILIEHNGNPHIVCFRERNGDPMGDAESFNVMLAVAEKTSNDLLFVGGDFNNQPFLALERAETP